MNKPKKLITQIAIIVIATFIGSRSTKAGNKKIDYSFEKKFQELKIKSKLKIITVKNFDYFEDALKQCIPTFYHNLNGAKGYYLEDPPKINSIGIEEYVFKDTIAANNACRIAYNYAESVRKMHRKDFAKRCFAMPAPQIYYASKNGTHVYLYTENYNFKFYHAGEDSIDTNMQNDKRILLDDVYREMSQSR